MDDRSRASQACDRCRRRKTRCDSEAPCSNCRIAHYDCRRTAEPQRRGPKPRHRREARTAPTASIPDHIAGDTQDFFQDTVASADHHSMPDLGAVHTQQSSTVPKTLRRHLPLVTSSVAPSCSCSAIAVQAAWESLFRGSPDVYHCIKLCIELYIRYIFPTAPIVHEASLRETLQHVATETFPTKFFFHCDDTVRISGCRSFTLLSALCASVAAVMPQTILPDADWLATSCLSASRAILHIYEDYDAEHPNSTSLVIRMFQSTALQHCTGKTGAAFHVVGEAALLALTLQLHKTPTTSSDDPVESQLLHASFRQLYASDQAASCLETRPSVLWGALGKMNLDTPQNQKRTADLLKITTTGFDMSFEDCLWQGWQYQIRLWSSAASLVADARAQFGAQEQCRTDERKRLRQNYLDFATSLDALPPWLQASYLATPRAESGQSVSEIDSFWVQRCTITMTWRFLKVLITKQCIDSYLFDVLGVLDQRISLQAKMAEVIQNFLTTMEDIPFIYHQIKGEPGIERIRRVGAIILEMQATVEEERLKSGFEQGLERLLAVLARLDSKAVTSLSKDSA